MSTLVLSAFADEAATDLQTQLKALSALDRVSEIGQALGMRNIRQFSFYPPQANTTANRYVDQAITRLERLIGLARRKDALLFLENEMGVVGDSLFRCYRLMRSLVGDYFRFLWNPANFVRVGSRR
ncbi:MAG: hypothetical protein SVR81_10550 [Chloroflexota bacterium]|nr:hypothetical protein [Chloroflexota bacterium]